MMKSLLETNRAVGYPPRGNEVELQVAVLVVHAEVIHPAGVRIV